MGYRALLPLAINGPRGGLPAQFKSGHSEIRACFLPESMDQWGNFHFKCLLCWPFPFPPACCLAHLLQCVGVGHKPVWLSHTLRHFVLGHELSDVGDSGGRQANILPSNLETPSPCREEALGQLQGCASYPRCQWEDQLIPGHLIFCDAPDPQLQPAGGPPSRINGFKHCLLLANIHVVTLLPARASPGGFHPLCSWFSMAAPIPPNYAADRHVRVLEVILPCIFII